MHRRAFVSFVAASASVAAVSVGNQPVLQPETLSGADSAPSQPRQEKSPRPEKPPREQAASTPEKFDVGAFSVSLSVKDLAASRAFYEKLGFESFAGDASQNWLILRNGAHVIGLFQGMFERNLLTFNPGWDQNAEKLKAFTDVRALQRRLKAQGVKLATEADETTTGPASFMVIDPDGNPVLFDQHV